MYVKIRLFFTLTFLGLFSVFGHTTTDDNNEILIRKLQTIAQDELANAVNSLGYKITQQIMSESNNKNVIISPTGIAGLLAMTLLGTVGKTYDELTNILGFSQDVRINRVNHEQFGNLLKSLNSNETSSKTLYADALFVDGTSKLREAYTNYLNNVYNGEVRGVDFTERDAVKSEINEWASNHTGGRIFDFLKEPLPLNTKAVLMSALYFSGQWKHPFLSQYTMKLPFKKTNEEVMVDLMINMGEFDQIYSLEDDLHMIALPYNDSTTTLYALKPRRSKHTTITELMNKLNYTRISELIGQMRSKKTVIRFPKMDLKSTASLGKTLKQLGVQSIFIPGQANFALMIDNDYSSNKTNIAVETRIDDMEQDIRSIIDALPNPGVHVDTILHDVRIKIDEYGTEAVAATAGILAKTAELFYCDSPFYMFIRNEATKLVTFSAVIFDPTV